MSFPIKSLPVVQNWDCHATGQCCKEYRILLSLDEVERIRAQGWTAEELGGHEPFTGTGLFSSQLQLAHRADGSCVFLSEQGRCRIHEKHGYETKPLPCRLFPFILVPAGDHWRVGMRFACPSVAENKGRSLPEHESDLRAFAEQMAVREKLTPLPDGNLTLPPRLDSGERLDWPDTLRIADALLAILKRPKETIELRLRKCLHVADLMRQAKLTDVRGDRLREMLRVLSAAADAEVPAAPTQLQSPGWVGRVLFRQAAALFTRKDHGPNRGSALAGPFTRIWAAWRFARGTGPIPQMNKRLPSATFEEAEVPRGPLPAEAERVLERYYLIKVASLQFCAASFGMPFWRGFEVLALTLPLILWTARLYKDVPRDRAVMNALTVVDDHYGFNPVLATFRQQLSFSILARNGELSKLIAWYSR